MGLNTATAPTPNHTHTPANLPPVDPMPNPGQMGNPLIGDMTPAMDSNAPSQTTVERADPEVISTSFLSSLAAEIEGVIQHLKLNHRHRVYVLLQIWL